MNQLSSTNTRGAVEFNHSRQFLSVDLGFGSKPLLEHKRHSGTLWSQLFHSYLLFDHSDLDPSMGCGSVQIPYVLVLGSRHGLVWLWSPHVLLCNIGLTMTAPCLRLRLLWSQPLFHGSHQCNMSSKNVGKTHACSSSFLMFRECVWCCMAFLCIKNPHGL